MPAQTFIYASGMPCQVVEGKATRTLSSVDSLHVREAVLTPQQSTPRLALAIGVFQRTAYAGSPIDMEQKIEQYTQEVINTYTGSNDPYPASLIALIYHERRKTAEDIRRDIFTDPLNRITFISHRNPPVFARKEHVSCEPWDKYDLLTSGSRRIEMISGAQEYLGILQKNRALYGLTRVEALKRLVLEQGNMQHHDNAFAKARHEFHMLFGYLKMIHTLELHVLEELAKEKEKKELT